MAPPLNTASLNGGGLFLFASHWKIRGISRFTDNKVDSKFKFGKGGAIFVMDKMEDCEVNSCSILWENNVSINFSSNFAKGGPILYGGMVNRCYSLKQNVSLSSTIKITYSF